MPMSDYYYSCWRHLHALVAAADAADAAHVAAVAAAPGQGVGRRPVV